MERRKFPRYNLVCKVLYKKTSSLLWRNETYTENISLGGLKIKVKKLLEEGERLKLKIFDPSVKAPIKAEAKVIWAKKISHIRNSGAIGLAFTRIGWTDTTRLLKNIATS